MEKTCRNCRFWFPNIGRKEETPLQANCIKLTSDPEIMDSHAFVMVDIEAITGEVGMEGEEAYETGMNFGCVHFEQKG